MRAACAPSAARAFASLSELTSASVTPLCDRSRSIAGTPANSGISPMCCAFSRRMSAPIAGSFQYGTFNAAMISREGLPRSVSISRSSIRRKPCRSAKEFTTVRNHGKLSDSVPSRSKMTSR
jgi:hypothetical protein